MQPSTEALLALLEPMEEVPVPWVLLDCPDMEPVLDDGDVVLVLGVVVCELEVEF